MSSSIDRHRDLVTRRGAIGRRIQICVTDRQYAMLREESTRTSLPMAELVRRAVDAVYRPNSRFRVRGFELNVGLWRDPDTAAVGGRVRRRDPPSDLNGSGR
jgi:Ribbon-helix-helix domain